MSLVLRLSLPINCVKPVEYEHLHIERVFPRTCNSFRTWNYCRNLEAFEFSFRIATKTCLELGCCFELMKKAIRQWKGIWSYLFRLFHTFWDRLTGTKTEWNSEKSHFHYNQCMNAIFLLALNWSAFQLKRQLFIPSNDFEYTNNSSKLSLINQ